MKKLMMTIGLAVISMTFLTCLILIGSHFIGDKNYVYVMSGWFTGDVYRYLRGKML